MLSHICYPISAARVTLSLRFNHEEFCDVHEVHCKTSAFAIFAGSGSLLEDRVALGRPERLITRLSGGFAEWL